MRLAASAVTVVLALGLLPASTAQAGPAGPKPFAKLWPKAVHSLPVKWKGEQVTPQQMLDRRHVLFSTTNGSDRTKAFYSYDVKTRKARKLGDVVTPQGANTVFLETATGGGRIFWSTSLNEQSQIWSMPVRGGKAKQIATSPATGTALGYDKGMLHWETRSTGGIYTLAKGAKKAVPIPGTTGYVIVGWPWVGKMAPWPKAAPGKPEFGKLWNVRTGAKRGFSFKSKGYWHCTSLVWCWANRPSRVMRRDGSGLRKLPGGAVQRFFRDRFAATADWDPQTDAGNAYITDLKTGRVGVLPHKSPWGFGDNDPSSTFFAQQVGRRFVVLDLAAIR